MYIYMLWGGCGYLHFYVAGVERVWVLSAWEQGGNRNTGIMCVGLGKGGDGNTCTCAAVHLGQTKHMA